MQRSALQHPLSWQRVQNPLLACGPPRLQRSTLLTRLGSWNDNRQRQDKITQDRTKEDMSPLVPGNPLMSVWSRPGCNSTQQKHNATAQYNAPQDKTRAGLDPDTTHHRTTQQTKLFRTQDKTRHDKTRQEKTREDRTKHGNTGILESTPGDRCPF